MNSHDERRDHTPAVHLAEPETTRARSHVSRGAHLSDYAASFSASPIQRRSLDQALLQFRAAVAEREAVGHGMNGEQHTQTHRVAQDGIRGAGSSLPHLERIQQAFGRHDISKVKAHVGGRAAAAATAIGAEAYATDNSVAFRTVPDLHTAAHEAAHVIQQKGGVQLRGGVGAAGDRYEQHADAVADAVVAGKSAESLLDRMAPPSSSSHGRNIVQRRPALPERKASAGKGSTEMDVSGLKVERADNGDRNTGAKLGDVGLSVGEKAETGAVTVAASLAIPIGGVSFNFSVSLTYDPSTEPGVLKLSGATAAGVGASKKVAINGYTNSVEFKGGYITADSIEVDVSSTVEVKLGARKGSAEERLFSKAIILHDVVLLPPSLIKMGTPTVRAEVLAPLLNTLLPNVTQDAVDVLEATGNAVADDPMGAAAEYAKLTPLGGAVDLVDRGVSAVGGGTIMDAIRSELK